MRSLKATFVVAATAALCACHGGGGTGGTSGTASGGLVVRPTQLTFVYVMGGTTPSSQVVSASWTTDDAAYFGAAYQNGGSKPSWLSLPQRASASAHSGSFSVDVSTSGATAGTWSTTFQVGIARADGSIIGSVDVTVTFIVKAFGADVAAISSTGVYGSSIAPTSSSLGVRGQPATTWTASVTPAGWLAVDPASGTTTGGYVTVSFDAAGLGTGTYSGTITFTSAGGAVDAVPVTLTVTNPTLTVKSSPLALAGLGGNDASPKKVQVSLNTGTNAYPYTVASNVDWIDLAQGVATASATPGVFTAAPSLAARDWASGTTGSGKLTITADVNGTPIAKTLDVSYLPDDLKLLVSEDGIALTKTPGLERLTRTVGVRTNRGVPASWTATSSQAWLAVTPSGTTGDPLVLTVPDPSSLGAGLHEATVTVSSKDARLAHGTETIRVGLWIGDVTPDPITTVTAGYTEVATDPVRPYAYVADGTATIRIHNVHTGGLEGTITVAGSPELASMTTSSDGQRLWALDGKLPLRHVVPIDLATRTAGTPWPVPGASNASQIAFARTNGVPLVVTSTGAIYDPETAAAVATYTTPDAWSALGVSRDGSRFCLVALGYSPTDLQCHDLAATTRGTSPVLVGPTKAAPWNSISVGNDLALSPDGARLFVASNGGFATFDASLPSGLVSLGTTGTAPAGMAIDVGADGRLYFGTDSYGGPSTALVYDASGNQLAGYALTGFIEGFIAVSGDGLRLVAGIGGYPSSTVTNSVKLVTLPAP